MSWDLCLPGPKFSRPVFQWPDVVCVTLRLSDLIRCPEQGWLTNCPSLSLRWCNYVEAMVQRLDCLRAVGSQYGLWELGLLGRSPLLLQGWIAAQECKVGLPASSVQLQNAARTQRFQCLGMALCCSSHRCVLVFDVTVADSFQALVARQANFLLWVDLPNPKQIPFVMFENKTDLPVGRVIGIPWRYCRFCPKTLQ